MPRATRPKNLKPGMDETPDLGWDEPDTPEPPPYVPPEGGPPTVEPPEAPVPPPPMTPDDAPPPVPGGLEDEEAPEPPPIVQPDPAAPEVSVGGPFVPLDPASRTPYRTPNFRNPARFAAFAGETPPAFPRRRRGGIGDEDWAKRASRAIGRSLRRG